MQDLKNQEYRKEKIWLHQPTIFPSIEISRVIPDIPHLFLRITDVLTILLIIELRRLDALNKMHSRSTPTSYTDHDHYEQFLTNECKISFKCYTEKESKELKWGDLVEQKN